MSFEKKESMTAGVTPVVSKHEGASYDIHDQAELAAIEHGMSGNVEKRLIRKIDLYLLPLLAFSYMLQFLDKQTLSYSSVMGLVKDLHLHGTQYSWTGSIFYFGYLAFSYPASYLMVRLPLGKYLAGTCVVWATCLACHAATSNFYGLMVVRFFLGAAEASIAPGFGLITGMWYKRSEQPFRCGLWFFGNSIALMFGGLLGYGIAHISGGIGPWRWLFIIFGVITLLWAGVLFWFLPDTQSNARFLSEEEKKMAIDRIRVNQTGLKDNTWRWDQVWEALTDIKIWLVVLYQLANSIPNGAITTFMSLVISGFGFNKLQVYLVQIPSGVTHGIAVLGATYVCSKFKDVRCFTNATLSIISLIASILVRYGPNTGSKLFGLFIFSAYVAGIPISLSMISSNVSGFTKKAVASAMMFIAYCVGNIVGPFLFFPSEAKKQYPSGLLATTLCFAVASFSMVALRFVLANENKRREKLQGIESRTSVADTEIEAFNLVDLTDKENLSFRYIL